MHLKSGLAPVLSLAGLLFAAEADARDPVVQSPSSNWQLDYGEDKCTLARAFGEGDDVTYLVISMYAPDDDANITVMRKERPNDAPDYRVQFGPDTDLTIIEYPMRANFNEDLKGVLFTLSFRPYEDAKRIRELNESERDPEVPYRSANWDEAARNAREKAITEFRIERAFDDDLVLATGSMGKPLQAIRTCVDELIGHWGLDAEVQRNLSRRAYPIESPEKWMTPADYPGNMLRAGYQGVVNFRLIVDPSGKPTRCIIQETSRPTDFADLSCKILMKKAKLAPALDKDGNPVTSFWSETIRFVLP